MLTTGDGGMALYPTRKKKQKKKDKKDPKKRRDNGLRFTSQPKSTSK